MNYKFRSKERIVHTWKMYSYTHEDLAEAGKVLTGLTPSVENSYAKSKAGSPQRTLLERRIKALRLAVQAIEGMC